MDILTALINELEGASVVETENKKEKAASKTEEEQAFVILASDPQPILQKLCEFEKLGFYKVTTGELLHIVDTFYDTADGLIRGGKSSLRVRETNGVPFVTVKGKNESKSGSSKRTELEVEWPWTGFNMPSPHDVAALFGMEQIQRRETERIARNIVRPHDQVLIAELAIDKVTYQFEGSTFPVKVYEVEVEMKSDKGANLATITKDLRKKFDDELWPWSNSKYAMGKVLEYATQIKFDDNGFITGNSFWALDRLKLS